jgi:hypothetical protein
MLFFIPSEIKPCFLFQPLTPSASNDQKSMDFLIWTLTFDLSLETCFFFFSLTDLRLCILQTRLQLIQKLSTNLVKLRNGMHFRPEFFRKVHSEAFRVFLPLCSKTDASIGPCTHPCKTAFRQTTEDGRKTD